MHSLLTVYVKSRFSFAVKPLTVIIRRPGRKGISNESLLAGKRYDMECETAGSRPPAVITWYKGRRRQLKHTTVSDGDGEITVEN